MLKLLLGLYGMSSMNHYVYLLEDKRKPMWYIGARSCSCAIGEDKYMGSSKSMTKEDKASCRKIILGRFDTRKEAIAYEIELHNRFNVAVSKEFYNKAKQTSTGWDTTGITSWNKGIAMSSEAKEKLSQSCKGKIRSEETKYKMGSASRGKVSHRKGKTLDREWCDKISRSQMKKVICVETGVVYDSAKTAGISLGKSDGSHITKHLKGKYDTAYGHTWKYYKEIEELRNETIS